MTSFALPEDAKFGRRVRSTEGLELLAFKGWMITGDSAESSRPPSGSTLYAELLRNPLCLDKLLRVAAKSSKPSLLSTSKRGTSRLVGPQNSGLEDVRFCNVFSFSSSACGSALLVETALLKPVETCACRI